MFHIDSKRWRDLPLFDVGPPEVLRLAARGERLRPGALAGNAEVLPEEEADDALDLGGDEYEGRVWGRDIVVPLIMRCRQ